MILKKSLVRIIGIIFLIGMMCISITACDSSSDDEKKTKEFKEDVTEETTEEETKGPENEILKIKNITEGEFSYYENAIEWLLFEGRGSDAIALESDRYKNYLSDDIISKYVSERAEGYVTDILTQDKFPIFEESDYDYTDAKVPLFIQCKDESGSNVFGTFEEMKASMTNNRARYSYINDGTLKYQIYLWQEKSFSYDEVILKETEKYGFNNISVLSVDNENRIMELFDNTYCCYYQCEFDNDAKIISIQVSQDNMDKYYVFYELLKQYVDKGYYVSVRDFDNDGVEDIFLAGESYFGVFKYDGVKVNPSYKNSNTYANITEVTKNGYYYLDDEGGYLTASVLEIYAYSDENMGMDESFEVGYDKMGDYYFPVNDVWTLEEYIADKNRVLDSIRITETVYGRSMNYISADYLELFADTHGITEYIKNMEEEINKDWVNAYRYLLSTDNFDDLINKPVSDGMGVLESGGTIKGFCLHDWNNDGQPELFVQKEYGSYTATFCYEYNSADKTVNNLDYYIECFSGSNLSAYESLLPYYNELGGNGMLSSEKSMTLGYRVDNGNIVKFNNYAVSCMYYANVYEYNMNMQMVTSYSEEFDWSWVNDGTEMSELTYSPLEQGEKAVYDEIMSNYVPFDFVEISQDNITKYIVEDYISVD